MMVYFHGTALRVSVKMRDSRGNTSAIWHFRWTRYNHSLKLSAIEEINIINYFYVDTLIPEIQKLIFLH